MKLVSLFHGIKPPLLMKLCVYVISFAGDLHNVLLLIFMSLITLFSDILTYIPPNLLETNSAILS
jgi:hypothetical protein